MSVDTPPLETVPPHLRRRLREAHRDIRDARVRLAHTLEDVKEWIDSSPDPLTRYARQQALGKLPCTKDEAIVDCEKETP